MMQPRSTDDLLIAAGVAALATLTAAGAATHLAAHAALLVTEHRLLSPESGGMLDTAAALLSHPTQPTLAFAPDDTMHLPRGAWLYASSAPILGAIATAALMGYQTVSGWLHTSTPADSRWARPRDLRRLRVTKPGQLVLGTVNGKLIGTEPNHSVCVFGPTGSGKTTSFVIPALLEHDGPVIALSSRADFIHWTINARRRTGPVHVYDPLGLTDHPSAHWTPLRSCADWAEAHRVAYALTSASNDQSTQDRFWVGMGRKMLSALLHAAALNDLTMRDVARWVDTREAKEVTKILTDHQSFDALQTWQASLKRNERTLADIYASTELLLAAYTTPGMADTPPSQSLDPAELIAKNGTLYVCAPTQDQERLQPVLCALVNDVCRTAILRSEHLREPLTPSLRLILDEAANIAPMRDLAEIASTYRGYGIQIATLFHDYAQVRARYGVKAATVINNHSAILLLAGQTDRELLDLLTRLAGEHTEHATSHSWSQNSGTSQSSQPRYRPLAAIHELRQLPDDHAILIYRNLRPTKLRLRPWYCTPSLTHLARLEAA